MIVDQYEFLFFFICSFPGIYIASKKDLFITVNPKYNLFLLRLPFIAPIFFFLVGLPSYIINLIIQWIFPRLTDFIIVVFGLYAASFIPLAVSLIMIIAVKHIFSQEREDTSFMQRESELYIYFPSVESPGELRLNARYEIRNKKRKKNELIIQTQLTDLVVEIKEIEGHSMGFGEFGREIVVSEWGLEILREENLSGFISRSVKITDSRLFSPTRSDNSRYHQLVCQHTMPKLEPRTDIYIDKNSPRARVYDKKYYYNQNVLSEISDFNQTQEFFGGEFSFYHIGHRYWIVSKKARDVMVNRLEQRLKDFIPVFLVDDDGNVIDS